MCEREILPTKRPALFLMNPDSANIPSALFVSCTYIVAACTQALLPPFFFFLHQPACRRQKVGCVPSDHSILCVCILPGDIFYRSLHIHNARTFLKMYNPVFQDMYFIHQTYLQIFLCPGVFKTDHICSSFFFVDEGMSSLCFCSCKMSSFVLGSQRYSSCNNSGRPMPSGLWISFTLRDAVTRTQLSFISYTCSSATSFLFLFVVWKRPASL